MFRCGDPSHARSYTFPIIAQSVQATSCNPSAPVPQPTSTTSLTTHSINHHPPMSATEGQHLDCHVALPDLFKPVER